jgi:hypothetical protein
MTNRIEEPEIFMIHIKETGKMVPLRDCPDELLQRVLKESNAKAAQLSQSMQQVLAAISQQSAFESTVMYELDRRGRSLVIATSIPRTN